MLVFPKAVVPLRTCSYMYDFLPPDGHAADSSLGSLIVTVRVLPCRSEELQEGTRRLHLIRGEWTC